MQTMTRREWAISKGLAKPTRGRMSREAHAECDRAEKAGEVKFSEAVKPTPAPRVTTPKAETKPLVVDKADYSPRAVREWARKNNIEVSSRGRIDSTVVQSYLADVDKPEARTEVVAGKDLREAAARVRWADTYTGEGITKTWRDVCNKCCYSIGWCTCAGGPWAFASDTVTMVGLSPTD